MKQNEQLKIYAERLRLYHINTHLEEMIHEAQIHKPSYLDLHSNCYTRKWYAAKRRILKEGFRLPTCPESMTWITSILISLPELPNHNLKNWENSYCYNRIIISYWWAPREPERLLLPPGCFMRRSNMDNKPIWRPWRRILQSFKWKKSPHPLWRLTTAW